MNRSSFILRLVMNLKKMSPAFYTVVIISLLVKLVITSPKIVIWYKFNVVNAQKNYLEKISSDITMNVQMWKSTVNSSNARWSF